MESVISRILKMAVTEIPSPYHGKVMKAGLFLSTSSCLMIPLSITAIGLFLTLWWRRNIFQIFRILAWLSPPSTTMQHCIRLQKATRGSATATYQFQGSKMSRMQWSWCTQRIWGWRLLAKVMTWRLISQTVSVFWDAAFCLQSESESCHPCRQFFLFRQLSLV